MSGVYYGVERLMTRVFDDGYCGKRWPRGNVDSKSLSLAAGRKVVQMHDRNGTPLKVGDVVLIEATVDSLSPGEDYCNVSLRTTNGRRPDGNKEYISAINTGVLVLIKRDTP